MAVQPAGNYCRGRGGDGVSVSRADAPEVFSRIGRHDSCCIKKTAGLSAVANMDQWLKRHNRHTSD